MKAKITFFPLGNADTTLIQIEDTGKTILWDYANKRSADDPNDKRCDLPKELNKRVKGDYDVVCFTHADDDHVCKMSEYFYLEHAQKYQGGERKKIKDLWVPAAVLVDKESNNDEDNILKAEAKHRLRNGKGVKIFSKPSKLKETLDKLGIDFESVKHLIVDAGTLVPGWSKQQEGIEFFVHSPFMGHVDENEIIDRNESAILAQAVFGNKVETKFMLGADGKFETWAAITKITRLHGNADRLLWDIFHLSHHCSFTALSDEKGKQKTNPAKDIHWLYETQSQQNCLLVSPSCEIVFEDSTQPPHFQAFNYYKEDVANSKKGKILVTMEYPTIQKPGPLEVNVKEDGFVVGTELTAEEKRAAAESIAKKSVVSGNWSDDGNI